MELQTSIVLACATILMAILAMASNIRLAHMVRKKRHETNILKLRKVVNKSRTAVRNGLISPTETILLACEAGMTLEQVRLEYVKENKTRNELLQEIFGKLEAKFVERFKATSHFMEHGYANEKFFLSLETQLGGNQKSLLQECPTQMMSVEASQEQEAGGAKRSEYEKKESAFCCSEAVPLIGEGA